MPERPGRGGGRPGGPAGRGSAGGRGMDRGGGRGGDGGGGARDLLSRIGKAALAIVAALLVVWILFTFACSNTNISLPGINLGGVNTGGGGMPSLLGGTTDILSSKHTDDNDRKNWATVQDIDGNERKSPYWPGCYQK